MKITFMKRLRQAPTHYSGTLCEYRLPDSEPVSENILAGELRRGAPMSGAMMLHSDTVDKPLTDLELGDLATGFGKIDATLPPPPRRGFFIVDVLGKTMSFMLDDATISFRRAVRAISLRGLGG